MKQTVNITTAIKKGGEEYKTTLLIDWDGVTQERMLELAARSVIIVTQGKYRRAGVIPATDSIKAIEIGTRSGFELTPERLMAAAATFTPEQRLELLQALQEQGASGMQAEVINASRELVGLKKK